jgi:hypothetical protein
VNLQLSFVGQSLFSELTQLLLFEIQDNNKNKNKPENHGKINNLEELKELKNPEDAF